jgi:hypothetical protein
VVLSNEPSIHLLSSILLLDWLCGKCVHKSILLCSRGNCACYNVDSAYNELTDQTSARVFDLLSPDRAHLQPQPRLHQC